MELAAGIVGVLIALAGLIGFDAAAARWGADSRQLDRDDARWVIR
jgi:hypothetical protein